MSRKAKLNYLTATVIEQYFCMPCSLMCCCVTWGLFRWVFGGGLNDWVVPVRQLGVFPTFVPCLEHVCAGGGGSVANMGLVSFYRRGL